MRLFLNILTSIASAALIMLVASSCNGPVSLESIEESLRSAESAIAKGDMKVAQSVACNISDSLTLDRMSVNQLGRLSMVFMQVADSLEQSANTETATDIYDRAFRTDADSARNFYNSIEPERMQFVETLTASSASRRNPFDISAVVPDSGFHENNFDQLPDSIQ